MTVDQTEQQDRGGGHGQSASEVFASTPHRHHQEESEQYGRGRAREEEDEKEPVKTRNHAGGLLSLFFEWVSRRHVLTIIHTDKER